MKNQPKLDIPTSTLERIFDFTAILFACCALLLAYTQFGSLPEQIPTHINAQGDVDNFGSKSSIFLLPALAIFMAIGMAILARFPHKFNYLAKITPENAAFEYQRSRFIMRVTNMLTSLLFLVITGEFIQLATGESGNLTALFWVVLGTLLIAPIVLFFYWPKPKQL